MPDLKISQLTAGNPALTGDLLPIDRSGANFAVTAGSIAALASGSPAFNTAGQGGFWGPGLDESVIYGAGMSSGPASVSGNQVTAIQFELLYSITIRHISCNVTAGSSSQTVNFGIYDVNGNKLVEASFSTTATGHKNVSVTPTVLTPGIYYFAQSSSTSSISVTAFNIASVIVVDLMNVNGVKIGQSPNPTSGGVMPATLGVLVADSIYPNAGAALFEP